MNANAKRYFAFNSVTGLFWNGKSFNSPSCVSVDPNEDWTIPAHALPVMRATWDNVKFIEAN